MLDHLIPSRHTHLTFQGSSFWGQDFKNNTQIISRRKYKISHQDLTIVINRAWHDPFDVLGIEALKRYCMAKGKIEWVENVANLNLEIRLKPIYEILYIVQVLGFGLGWLSFFFTNWEIGLAIWLFWSFSFLFTLLTVRLVLKRFQTELEHDINFFKIKNDV